MDTFNAALHTDDALYSELSHCLTKLRMCGWSASWPKSTPSPNDLNTIITNHAAIREHHRLKQELFEVCMQLDPSDRAAVQSEECSLSPEAQDRLLQQGGGEQPRRPKDACQHQHHRQRYFENLAFPVSLMARNLPRCPAGGPGATKAIPLPHRNPERDFMYSPARFASRS
ncbi:hypothetical protein AYL99_12048 [Fonsecaea erecta]|uniref:Uncharacterized protein n=1 Tax=Fonsecaea erecta TaxID=1367422 RepID=A0A178Z240_9EURO|nr:hypothetical protein AYL99_12048 [Fonsecaea erecta]OAP53764.1 hypothetical protein AYL99_12048 [Fonsecaea erecta]